MRLRFSNRSQKTLKCGKNTRLRLVCHFFCSYHILTSSGQFVDDTPLLCSSCESVKNAIQVLNNFGAISGLRLNPSKTKALWLGPWRHKVDEPFQFYWPKEPIRALGIFISYHQKQNEVKNFKAKVDELSTILDIWQSRNLTLLGRVLITKCLRISQLVYSMSILDTTYEYIKATNSLFLKFIWKKKSKTRLNEK